MSEWGIRIISALFLCAVLFGSGYYVGASRTAKSYAEAAAEQIQSLNEKLKAQDSNTDKIITKYVTKTETIEVPVYVPSPNTCRAFDGAFRVFYDYSASGIVPKTSRASDAAPVPIEDVASTTRDNFIGCRKNTEQLKALQEWADMVSK